MIDFKQHFELQDRLNRVINPDWLTAGYRWSDAAMVEAVEAFDHLAWKWWKHGTDNMSQFRLELVDIWHFELSFLMVVNRGMTHEAIADAIQREQTALMARHAKSGNLVDSLRLFIAACAEYTMPLGLFFRLCELADLSLPELDRMYRAKGVLNLFRQANGYKDGTYVKQWAEREDNVWLDAIMATTPDATADQLMDQLSRIYHDVLSGATFHNLAVTFATNNIAPNLAVVAGDANTIVGKISVDTSATERALAAIEKLYEPDEYVDAFKGRVVPDDEIGFVALDKRAARTIDILAVGSGHSSLDTATPPFPAIDWQRHPDSSAQCSNTEICFPVTGDVAFDYCDKCGRSA